MSVAVSTPPQATGRARGVRRRGRPSAFSYFAAVLIALAVVVPVLFVIIGGFRTNAQINADPVGLSGPWHLGNYADVLRSASFWRQAGNSTFIALIATVVAVTCGAGAAFALSRYSFRGREALYTYFTLGLLFPIGVGILPLYILVKDAGLLDNPLGVALPEAAFQLPVTIVILRPFMHAVPGEIEDAATMDGCTKLGFFWRILLPLSRPALVTVAILAFVLSWNNFLLPLLMFNDTDQWTLPLGVANYSTEHTTDTAKILAFTTLSMIPALVFFLLAERRIVGGLTGAVKG